MSGTASILKFENSLPFIDQDGPARGVGRPEKIACRARAREGRHGEREGARNRRERLVVGRSVEARSREPADEASLESRVFHDERARHNDRGGKGEGGWRGRSARGVEARYAM